MVTYSYEYGQVENTTSDRTGKDITDEIEVEAEEIDIFSIEELVPSSTPITIPYLEVYRTNELEYVPYMSPYNVGIQSSSSDSTESEDTSDSSDSSDTGDETNNDSGTDSSSDSSNN